MARLAALWVVLVVAEGLAPAPAPKPRPRVLRRSSPVAASCRAVAPAARAANAAVLGGLAVAAAGAVLHADAQQCVELWRHGLPSAETPADVLARLPGDWLAWYDDAVLAHPLVVKASTSCVCYFAGDVAAQALRSQAPLADLDLRRAARSAAAGFVGHGPVAHYWLGLMDSLHFGDGVLGALPKIALDQGPMSVVYNTVYTVLIGAFALRRPADIWTDVRDTWAPGMAVSLKFWPLFHLVTFSALIPSELKLLWVDAMEIIWIAILSQVNNDARPAPDPARSPLT